MLSSLLIVFMIVLLACAALAIDLTLLGTAHQQLESGATTAARASAPHLADRSVLYPHIQAKGEADSLRADLARMRAASARREAIDFAAKNVATGQRIALVANEQNAADGDIVIGTVREPLELGDALLPPRADAPANTVLVRARRTAARGNPLQLWFGQLFGLPEMDGEAIAQATLERRVVGFRPTELADSPVMPIVIDVDTWYEGATSASHEDDRFLVHEPTGEFLSGGDGIPEIRVRLQRRKKSHDEHNKGDHEKHQPATGWPTVYSAEDSPVVFARQAATGITAADLAPFGGELTLGRDGRLLVSSLPLPQNWRAGLAAAAGKFRVWPLGRKEEIDGRPALVIVGFAGGRLLGTEGEDLIVQPCIVLNPTAVCRRGAQKNPWIGKVLLTR